MCDFTTGTAVRLLGFSEAVQETNVSDSSELKCTIDGFIVQTKSAIPEASMNKGFSFCEWHRGRPGLHTLAFTARSLSGPLWIDRLEYVPSAGMDLPAGSTVLIGHDDKAIKYYKDNVRILEDMGLSSLSGMILDPSAGDYRIEIDFEGEFSP